MKNSEKRTEQQQKNVAPVKKTLDIENRNKAKENKENSKKTTTQDGFKTPRDIKSAEQRDQFS